MSALIMMMFSCDHVCGLGVGRKGVGAKRMETKGLKRRVNR